MELAERLERAWDTTPDREWLPQAQVELENWRAALEWALGKRGDVILGQRLAAATECSVAQLSQLSRDGVGCGQRSNWSTNAPRLIWWRGSNTPRRRSLASAVNARCRWPRRSGLLHGIAELGDVRGSAQAQGLAGNSAYNSRESCGGRAAATRGLGGGAHAAAIGGWPLSSYGTSELFVAAAGDFAGARAYLTEALGLANVLGAELLAADVAINLADNEYDAGDAETALRLMLDVLAIYRAMKSPTAVSGTAKALACSMIYLFALGRYDEARIHANEALDLGLRLGMASLVAASLQYLALTVLVRPKADRPCTSEVCAGVARLLGFVNARLASLGVSELYPTPHRYDRAIAMLREEFTVDEFEHQMAIGATMTEDEAVTEAHALK